MTTTKKTLCDGCSRDLTYTGNCEAYRLGLHNESIPNYPGGGAVTDMAAYVPLKDGSKHFCSIVCLRKWLSHDD
jgi:hypothetical protein